MVEKRKLNTVYLQYLNMVLTDMEGEGVYSFTLKQFADRAGLKVTPSMRRRFHQFVADGKLWYGRAKALHENQALLYMFPIWTEELAGAE